MTNEDVKQSRELATRAYTQTMEAFGKGNEELATLDAFLCLFDPRVTQWRTRMDVICTAGEDEPKQERSTFLNSAALVVIGMLIGLALAVAAPSVRKLFDKETDGLCGDSGEYDRDGGTDQAGAACLSVVEAQGFEDGRGFVELVTEVPCAYLFFDGVFVFDFFHRG